MPGQQFISVDCDGFYYPGRERPPSRLCDLILYPLGENGEVAPLPMKGEGPPSRVRFELVRLEDRAVVARANIGLPRDPKGARRVLRRTTERFASIAREEGLMPNEDPAP